MRSMANSLLTSNQSCNYSRDGTRNMFLANSAVSLVKVHITSLQALRYLP